MHSRRPVHGFWQDSYIYEGVNWGLVSRHPRQQKRSVYSLGSVSLLLFVVQVDLPSTVSTLYLGPSNQGLGHESW